MDEITKVVLDYVILEYLEEGDEREITPTTPLISSGIIDLFSMVSLRRFLERKYAIRIPDGAATPEVFDTVQGIAALVRRLQGSASAVA